MGSFSRRVGVRVIGKNKTNKQKKTPRFEAFWGKSKVSFHGDTVSVFGGLWVERTQVADSLALTENSLTDQLGLPFWGG